MATIWIDSVVPGKGPLELLLRGSGRLENLGRKYLLNRARRRPQRDRSDSGSEDRPAYKPKAKKGAHPAVVIVTLVLLISTVSIFAYSILNRPKEPKIVIEETTSDKEYRAIQRDISQSQVMARKVVQMRSDDDSKKFAREWQKAMNFSSGTQQKLREMLAEVRTPEGILPPEFSGYNSDFSKIQTIIGDLSKVAPMFTED